MNIEMKDAFNAESQSVRDFLVPAGRGCYMPAYQRPYAWGNQEISRLFEDVIHGIRQLAKSRTSTTQNESVARFLGAIIALHDSDYKTVQPIDRSAVPSQVMTIIDGQQRICTIVMVNAALHNRIERLVHSFHRLSEREPNNEVWKWICNECKSLLPDIRDTYLNDQKAGEGYYKYYPRVIRAYDDVWAGKKERAKYDSPVADFIWKYILFSEEQAQKSTKPKIFNFSGSDKPVSNAFREIKKYIGLISNPSKLPKKNPPEFLRNFLSFSETAEFFGESGFKKFWAFKPNEETSEQISAYLKNDSNSQHKEFCELLRLVIFARYLNRCVAITVITTKNEDGAFDMFEALNTTGQPLTAFETFKPKVIERESLEKYKDSKSYSQIKKVEEYLHEFEKPSEKTEKTFEMLVAFALAETGEALPKRLNDQRRYLRDEYNCFQDNSKSSLDFVSSLANTASFFHFGWDNLGGPTPKFTPLEITDDAALVGFDALRKIKHSITIAPLSRFYQYAVDAIGNGEVEKEFIAALKATVAFSFLWRGAYGGTENIDSHYRRIMESMARRPKKGGTGLVAVKKYISSLLNILAKGNIGTEEQWVSKAHKVDYKKYKDVSRFILFCAADDTVPDKSNPGLVQEGRPGVSPLLSPRQWHQEELFTVEHIAPQSPKGNWDDSIYDEDWVNTLGNLTLLPKEENIILSNRPWEEKKLIYRLLSAQTTEELNLCKEELSKARVSTTRTADSILNNSKYLKLCHSIAQSEEWNASLIERRSKCLAKLAWKRLNSWLE